MTIAAKQRHADEARVLKTLAVELGDRRATVVEWAVTSPSLMDVLPTTWASLTERGLVQPGKLLAGPAQYGLTERGWLEGLRLSGAFEDEAFRSRCVELVKYFKAAVDGRNLHRDAILLLEPMPVRRGL